MKKKTVSNYHFWEKHLLDMEYQWPIKDVTVMVAENLAWQGITWELMSNLWVHARFV